MAIRQTRRTISLRAQVFATVQQHAAARGVSACSFVEAAITNALTAAGVDIMPRDEALKILGILREKRAEEVKEPTGIWTF
jgi:hypothetical protein